MRLVQKAEGPIHISHFMNLVSAYEPSETMVADLWRRIQEAKVEARESRRGVIVEQDCVDFFFVVHPVGSLDLCARLRTYEESVEEVDDERKFLVKILGSSS